MLDPPALRAALTGAHALAVPVTGLVFRTSHLQHFSSFSTAQPLYCAPAGPAGSRFVAPGGPAALYLAFDAETAYMEVNQDYYRIARTRPGRTLVRTGLLRPVPCAMLGVYLRLRRVLSLAAPFRHWQRTRAGLGIQTRSNAELTQPWAGIPHAATQALGHDVFQDGFFEGIIYPSAQNPGHPCVVVFRDRLRPGSRVHFADAATALTGELP